MFTWICPKCGKENDVAQKSCAHCAVPESPSSERPSLPQSKASDTAAPVPPQQPQAAGPRSALEVRPVHLLLFAVVMIAAVGGAVWLSQPDLLRLETVEDPDDEMVRTFARSVQGPFEVAGVRPYYTDDYQTKVKAFVVNHSDEARSAALRVHLRHQQATDNAPPLASFDVIASEPLAGQGSREIDTTLEALGSLQSLPPWNEIRIDIENK